MLTLIYGGSGSGKSEYAESVAVAQRDTISKLYYIATMQVYDEESRQRVARHRKLRAGKGFQTIECGRDVGELVVNDIDAGSTVLLECLSNLVANEMFTPEGILPSEIIAEKIFTDLVKLQKKCKHLVVVSNDIFSDGGSYDEGTLQYIRALGILHQKLATIAQRVTEVVYGVPIVIL